MTRSVGETLFVRHGPRHLQQWCTSVVALGGDGPAQLIEVVAGRTATRVCDWLAPQPLRVVDVAVQRHAHLQHYGSCRPPRGLVPLTPPSYSAPIGAVSYVTLDRTFFALSDSTRRSILTRLADGPATIGDLAGPFGLTLNGVKKHVMILEEVDLVVTTKVGRSRECLTTAVLREST